MLRRAPLGALLWSAWASAQPAPPPPPAPPAQPAPPPPLPPVSAGATSVREPDSAPAPPPPPVDLGPDTLPSLDEDEPPAAAEPQVAAPIAAPRPPPPVRAQRRIALLGELGWNGLAGFGAIVSYHVHPQLTFDLGAGLAAVGGKLGLRARYNVSTKSVTPFLGVGVMGATGFDAPTRDIGDDDNSDLNIELKPAAFVQAVAGIDWTSPGGFTLLGAVGYAWLVTGDTVVILTGVPTEEETRALDAVFRSGVVISIAIGYSFR